MEIYFLGDLMKFKNKKNKYVFEVKKDYLKKLLELVFKIFHF